MTDLTQPVLNSATQNALVPLPKLVWDAFEITDLPPNGCKYPVAQDDFGTHLFCGQIAIGGPYCERCAPLCYVTLRPLRESRRRLVLPRLR